MSDAPTPKDGGCAFCRIASGEAEAWIVFEDRVSLAFLDYRPLFAGHCLLIPRDHHETLPDLPPPLLAPLFANARLLARAVEEGLGAEGTLVGINNRVDQSVPHLHVHVVPRRRGDGLRDLYAPRQPYASEAAALDAQARLREALDRLREGRPA